MLEKIAEMKDWDRNMAARLHAVIKASAPGLSPRLWYGQLTDAEDGRIKALVKKAVS